MNYYQLYKYPLLAAKNDFEKQYFTLDISLREIPLYRRIFFIFSDKFREKSKKKVCENIFIQIGRYFRSNAEEEKESAEVRIAKVR